MHCDCIAGLSRLRLGKQSGVFNIKKRPRIRQNTSGTSGRLKKYTAVSESFEIKQNLNRW